MATIEQLAKTQQAYTAKQDSQNVFTPRNQANVSRSDSLADDIFGIMKSATNVLAMQKEQTTEAVKRVALDKYQQMQLQQAEILSTVDDKSDISRVKAAISTSFESNYVAYEDEEKQHIFDTLFTMPSKTSTTEIIGKLNKEGRRRDKIAVLTSVGEFVSTSPSSKTKEQLDVQYDMVEKVGENGNYVYESHLKALGDEWVSNVATEITSIDDDASAKNLFNKTYGAYATIDKDGNTIWKTDNELIRGVVTDNLTKMRKIGAERVAALQKQQEEEIDASIDMSSSLGGNFTPEQLETLYKERNIKITPKQLASLEKKKLDYTINNLENRRSVFRADPTRDSLEASLEPMTDEHKKQLVNYHTNKIMALSGEQRENAIQGLINSNNTSILKEVSRTMASTISSINPESGYVHFKNYRKTFKNPSFLNAVRESYGSNSQKLGEYLATLSIYESDVSTGSENTTLTPEMVGIMKSSTTSDVNLRMSENDTWNDIVDNSKDYTLKTQRDIYNIGRALFMAGREDLLTIATTPYLQKFIDVNGAKVELTMDDKKMLDNKGFFTADKILDRLVKSKTVYSENEDENLFIKEQILGGNITLEDDNVGDRKTLTVFDGEQVVYSGKVYLTGLMSKVSTSTDYEMKIQDSLTGRDAMEFGISEQQVNEFRSQGKVSLDNMKKINKGIPIGIQDAIDSIKEIVNSNLDTEQILETTTKMKDYISSAYDSIKNSIYENIDDYMNGDKTEKQALDYINSSIDGVSKDKVTKEDFNKYLNNKEDIDKDIDEKKNSTLTDVSTEDNFTSNGVFSNTGDITFVDENYTGASFVNVPSDMSGITVGGMDVANGNINAIVKILEESGKIDKDMIAKLASSSKLTGKAAKKALEEMNIKANFSNADIKEMQMKYVKRVKVPEITAIIGKETWSKVPDSIKAPILAVSFLNVGERSLKAVKKGVETGNWSAAIKEYGNYWKDKNPHNIKRTNRVINAIKKYISKKGY